MATFIEIGPHLINVDAISGVHVSEGGKRVQLYYVGGGTGGPGLYTHEEAELFLEAVRPLLIARCILSTERLTEDASAPRGHRVVRDPGFVERLT